MLFARFVVYLVLLRLLRVLGRLVLAEAVAYLVCLVCGGQCVSCEEEFARPENVPGMVV